MCDYCVDEVGAKMDEIACIRSFVELALERRVGIRNARTVVTDIVFGYCAIFVFIER